MGLGVGNDTFEKFSLSDLPDSLQSEKRLEAKKKMLNEVFTIELHIMSRHKLQCELKECIAVTYV